MSYYTSHQQDATIVERAKAANKQWRYC